MKAVYSARAAGAGPRPPRGNVGPLFHARSNVGPLFHARSNVGPLFHIRGFFPTIAWTIPRWVVTPRGGATEARALAYEGREMEMQIERRQRRRRLACVLRVFQSVPVAQFDVQTHAKAAQATKNNGAVPPQPRHPGGRAPASC